MNNMFIEKYCWHSTVQGVASVVSRVQKEDRKIGRFQGHEERQEDLTLGAVRTQPSTY